MKKLYLLATFFLGLHGLLILAGIVVNWENLSSVSPFQGPGFRFLLVSLLVYGLLAKTPWGWWGSVLYSAFVSFIGIGLIILQILATDQTENILSNELYTFFVTPILLGLSAVFLIYPVINNRAKKS